MPHSYCQKGGPWTPRSSERRCGLAIPQSWGYSTLIQSTWPYCRPTSPRTITKVSPSLLPRPIPPGLEPPPSAQAMTTFGRVGSTIDPSVHLTKRQVDILGRPARRYAPQADCRPTRPLLRDRRRRPRSGRPDLRNPWPNPPTQRCHRTRVHPSAPPQPKIHPDPPPANP